MNKENVQRLIDEGKTKGEIAELLGVLVKTLDMFLNAHELSVNEAVVDDNKWSNVIDTEEDESAQNEREGVSKLSRRPQNTRRIIVDEQELFDLYVKEEWTRKRVAEHFGVSVSKIANVLREIGVEPRKRTSAIKATKEEIEHMYKVEGMKRQEIADKFDVSLQTVDLFMKKHRITLDDKRGRPRGEHFSKDKEEFEELLEEYRSVTELSEHYGITKQTVYYYINKFGLREKYETIYQRKRRSSNV